MKFRSFKFILYSTAQKYLPVCRFQRIASNSLEFLIILTCATLKYLSQSPHFLYNFYLVFLSSLLFLSAFISAVSCLFIFFARADRSSAYQRAICWIFWRRNFKLNQNNKQNWIRSWKCNLIFNQRKKELRFKIFATTF